MAGDRQNHSIANRAPQGKDVTGRLFVPKPDGNGMMPLKFKIDSAKAKAESRVEFLKAKENHYRQLVERNVPGGAWFRHQERETAKARGAKATDRPVNPNRFGRNRGFELEESYDLFSGGRAVSENLQLDRLLAPSSPGAARVEI